MSILYCLNISKLAVSSACIVYTYLMIPQTKKVATMVFEERMVTHENGLNFFLGK